MRDPIECDQVLLDYIRVGCPIDTICNVSPIRNMCPVPDQGITFLSLFFLFVTYIPESNNMFVECVCVCVYALQNKGNLYGGVFGEIQKTQRF